MRSFPFDPMRLAALPLLCATSLLLSACPGPGPEVPDFPSEPAAWEDVLGLELMTGSYPDFVPVEDGDTLLLHRGFQGGQHVEVALRLPQQFENPTAYFELGLYEPETGRGLVQPFGFDSSFLSDPDGEVPLETILVFVDTPSLVLEGPVRLVARVQVDGKRGYAVRTVTVRWAP